MDAKKTQPKGKTGRTDTALSLIAKLYAVEKRHKASDGHMTQQARGTDSQPILEDLKQWLDKTQQQVPPTHTLGRAISYTLKHWPTLSRYTKNNAWPIDSNRAEDAIQAFVVGRKNWLFRNSHRGATASANLCSLIETAKTNGRETYHCLSWLFSSDRLRQNRQIMNQ